MSDNDKSVHSGNYYTFGVKRVLSKLADLGIEVPKQALEYPKSEHSFKPLREFTNIDHAVLDWFKDRDYDQAQALILYRPPRDEWHVIFVIDEEKIPVDLSHGMLCPTRLDALGAVIDGCDRAVVRIDECRKDGEALTVVISGTEVLRIEPIHIEPFDLAIRDRVRKAFKGAKYQNIQSMMECAIKLPGFKGVEVENAFGHTNPNLGVFLGFPENWSVAMRNALKQVSIEVKQSQAQELAAVFLGANSWHHLIKYRDMPNDGMAPVSLRFETDDGWRHRYYRTPEEAIFAVGNTIKNYKEPVVIQHFDLSLQENRAVIMATTERVFREPNPYFYLLPSCIDSGSNDYWNLDDNGTDEIANAAQQLLKRIDIDQGMTSAVGVLYDGSDVTALLEGILAREGIPADHLVYVGDHAFVVSYRPDPDGGSLQAAYIQIFKIEKNGPQKIPNGNVAMYKAEVTLIDAAGGKNLVITPNYGKGSPIVIPVGSLDQVKRLLALTHTKNLFSLSYPDVDFYKQQDYTL